MNALSPVDSRSYRARGINHIADSLDKGRKLGENTGLFGRLLSDKILADGEDRGLQKAIDPMDPRELQQIVLAIRSRINDAFFDAFDESDEDGALSGDPFEWINPPGIGHQMGLPQSRDRHFMQRTMYGQPTSPRSIDDIIGKASETYDMDPDLIHAVIRAESDFDENSTSSKGAMGLMQLMPETAGDLGVKNPYDPAENVMGGTRYLKSLLDRYDGQIPLALAAYNWGMGNVERHPGQLPEETRTYISRVSKYYGEAKQEPV